MKRLHDLSYGLLAWGLGLIAASPLIAETQTVAVVAEEGTDRLSPELALIQETQSELLGLTQDNEFVLEIPDETTRAFRTNDRVAQFSFQVPEFETDLRLMISYEGKDRPDEETLQKADLELIEDYERGSFLVVRPKNPLNASMLETLLQDEAVTYVQPSYHLSIPDERGPRIEQIPAANPALAPNDPFFPQLWGMTNIHATSAWDIVREAPNVIVAVIDTGVDYNHQDLHSNMWINTKEIPGNGIDDDGNGLIDDVYGYDFFSQDGDPMDEDDHGTHCAGTIAGIGNNGIGVTGVAWKTKIMALRFLGPGGGSTIDAIKCIDYAVDNGAHILNNSWGGGPFHKELSNAIDRARAKKVLFVAAAGNNNRNNDLIPSFPASYPQDNIISVAAIKEDNTKASFSHFGKKSVDLGAPGFGIVSTIRNNGYASFNGTSMATPHVSGAAALTWAVTKDANADSVRKTLFEKARAVPGLADLWGHDAAVRGGVLDIVFLASPPPTPPGADEPPVKPQPGTQVVATSAQFNFGKTASTDQTIAQATLVLEQPMQVHISANSSATISGDGGAILYTTGFSDQEDVGLMWNESLRFVSIATPGQWVNFGSTVTVNLPQGTHTLRWKVWLDQSKILLDSGSMSIQAFPIKSSSSGTLDLSNMQQATRGSAEVKMARDQAGNTILHRERTNPSGRPTNSNSAREARVSQASPY